MSIEAFDIALTAYELPHVLAALGHAARMCQASGHPEEADNLLAIQAKLCVQTGFKPPTPEPAHG